jgi:hypothetical protein
MNMSRLLLLEGAAPPRFVNQDANHFSQNPFWGTPQETFEKVAEFYRTDSIFHAIPVPGAREGIQSLKDMGYKLVIVTARIAEVADASWEWVEKYFPGKPMFAVNPVRTIADFEAQGMFANVVFTGQFKNAQKLHHNEVLTNLTKSGVR